VEDAESVIASYIEGQSICVLKKIPTVTLGSVLATAKYIHDNKHSIAHGEQSLYKLNLQGRQLTDVIIPREDIKLFKAELKKYAVDFSLKRDELASSIYVYFKAQDNERVLEAIEKCLSAFERRPLKERLAAAKVIAAERNLARKKHWEKNRDKARNIAREHVR